MDTFKVERTDYVECCDFESAIVVAENEADAVQQIVDADLFQHGVEPDGSNLVATLLGAHGRGIVQTRIRNEHY